MPTVSLFPLVQAAREENAALIAELTSANQGALQVERTIREVATLNQMFSTQVMHQAEQIEAIYSQVRNLTLCLDGFSMLLWHSESPPQYANATSRSELMYKETGIALDFKSAISYLKRH